MLLRKEFSMVEDSSLVTMQHLNVASVFSLESVH